MPADRDDARSDEDSREEKEHAHPIESSKRQIVRAQKDHQSISFGILLNGAGEVWLSSTKFDVVGTDVPVTVPDDRKIPNKPVNLQFTE